MIDQGYLQESYPKPKLGHSFWEAPDRENGFCWATEDIIRTKNNTPAFKFDALYLQNPSSETGGIIQVDYWQDWSSEDPPQCDFIIQSWDTAFSTRTTADYSVVTTWGIFKKMNLV